MTCEPPLDECGESGRGAKDPAMGACRTSRSEPPDRGRGQPDPGREERSATYGQDPWPTRRGANTLGTSPEKASAPTNNRRLTCHSWGIDASATTVAASGVSSQVYGHRATSTTRWRADLKALLDHLDAGSGRGAGRLLDGDRRGDAVPRHLRVGRREQGGAARRHPPASCLQTHRESQGRPQPASIDGIKTGDRCGPLRLLRGQPS